MREQARRRAEEDRPTQIWSYIAAGARALVAMPPRAAPRPDVELARTADWEAGKQAVQEEADGDKNPHKLWKAVPGSSKARGKATWRCGAHSNCGVELTLRRDAQGGCCLTKNDAKHTKAPPGGARR